MVGRRVQQLAALKRLSKLGPYFFVALVVILTIAHFYMHRSALRDGTPEASGGTLQAACPTVPAQASIFSRYCNAAPADAPAAGPVVVSSGAEGEIPGFELRSVTLAIRHGDRSAIHAQAAPGVHFSCALGDVSSVVERISQRLRFVSATSGAILQRDLRPQVQSGTEHCKPGQLTARGFRQHLALGKHLREAYTSLLNRLPVGGDGVYVRSTDYTRTLGSVSALLSSLFDWHAGGAADTPAVDVNIFEKEDEENMLHAARTSSFHGSALDCPLAMQLGRAQRAVWRRPPAEYAQLRSVLGAQADKHEVTDHADSFYAATCHRMPLPGGSGACVTPRLAEQICGHADTLYCSRFAGAQGGARATELAVYPFLHEVLEHLENVVAGRTSAAESSTSLRVYSGHDTVIAPVLAAMGVYRDGHCRWPPYASRIAIELHRRVASPGDEHLVRLLYNGEVMRGLRGCHASAELCPLANFSAGVASILRGARDYASACAGRA
eukprot:TRINITY_DN6646_c0_g1_i2.p1 TRINITY_DN6646_c0_g1~~TRINITY_DN6646_c0_g1_i2.p1  ORF type:complete len:558 (-),score=85.05 TRINITY_DN6646_c0_g1_i2:92-1579(-)